MHATPKKNAETPALVPLDADHPGFRDPVYRHRRDAIARAALGHRPGEQAPRIEYSVEEQAVWQAVWSRLRPLHQRHACAAIRAHQDRLRLDASPIPQLADLTHSLRAATNFRMEPVAGLVEGRAFLAALAERTFLSTQYLRHASSPFYTPEPDLVHELTGHVASLHDPALADLNAAFGRASLDAPPKQLTRLERVYWWSLEFGAVAENNEVKALGAGLLSSCTEIQRVTAGAQLLAFDPERMANRPYDPTALQPVLFVAPSLTAFTGDLKRFLRAQ